LPRQHPEDRVTTKTRFHIAAIGDIHYGSAGHHPFPPLAEVSADADALLLCGDLTDHGLPEEAQGLLKELLVVKIPVIAVLGNHDYESNRETEVQKILSDGGIKVLNGEACEVQGVGFAGAKGFAGGFGRRTLEPWGEKTVKAFVQEAVDETLKLESALSRLRTEHRIAVLHYAPIAGTVEGEPLDLFPFLGCSRLEEPLNRYRVTAAFHGHAHRGAPEGKTTSGIPVYNVSLPILRKECADRPPVRRFEIDLEQPPEP
jgi:Icc-related predicted phosphoesterase